MRHKKSLLGISKIARLQVSFESVANIIAYCYVTVYLTYIEILKD